MEELITLLPNYLIIGVIAAYILGSGLKKTNLLPDKYIPITLLTSCIAIATLLNMVNSEEMLALKTWVYGVLYGIITWGIAIGVDQIYKQGKKDK